jgi:hypothetical protein
MTEDLVEIYFPRIVALHQGDTLLRRGQKQHFVQEKLFHASSADACLPLLRGNRFRGQVIDAMQH